MMIIRLTADDYPTNDGEYDPYNDDTGGQRQLAGHSSWVSVAIARIIIMC